MMTKPLNTYERKSIHSIDEFLSNVEMSHTKRNSINFYGDLIKLGSDRYKLFKFKGIVCVKCECKGVFMAKERDKGTPFYHMNLYALDKDGNEVLMTKDHITPKSLGGKNNYDNYQTMCTTCNAEKSNKII